MDNETREILQKELDDIINKLNESENLKSITRWAMIELVGNIERDCIKEAKAAEYLAVGYVVGYLARVCHAIVLEESSRDKLEAILKKMQNKGTTKEEKVTKQIISKLRLTKKDAEEIREIIQPKIPKIREQVIKALNA